MIIEQGASPTIVFLLVDKADGITAKPGKSPTVQIAKNGGTFNPVSGQVGEMGNGWYRVQLTDAETNVAGPLVIRAWAADTLEWRDIHQVYADFNATLLDSVYDRIADHVLRRNFQEAVTADHGDAVAFRSLLGAVAKDVNRVELNGRNLVIYQHDDQTELGRQSVITNANATPITGIDTDEP